MRRRRCERGAQVTVAAHAEYRPLNAANILTAGATVSATATELSMVASRAVAIALRLTGISEQQSCRRVGARRVRLDRTPWRGRGDGVPRRDSRTARSRAGLLAGEERTSAGEAGSAAPQAASSPRFHRPGRTAARARLDTGRLPRGRAAALVRSLPAVQSRTDTTSCSETMVTMYWPPAAGAGQPRRPDVVRREPAKGDAGAARGSNRLFAEPATGVGIEEIGAAAGITVPASHTSSRPAHGRRNGSGAERYNLDLGARVDHRRTAGTAGATAFLHRLRLAHSSSTCRHQVDQRRRCDCTPGAAGLRGRMGTLLPRCTPIPSAGRYGSGGADRGPTTWLGSPPAPAALSDACTPVDSAIWTPFWPRFHRRPCC